MSELIAKIQSADEEAFRMLNDQWAGKLFVFGMAYTRNEEVTKELVQDVFVKLFENRKNIDDNQSLVSYMYTIMKNCCLDYIRHRKLEIRYDEAKRQEYCHLATNSYALQDESINIIVENEIKQSLAKAIENLPEKCRNVFVRNRFEGKKYRDIASELGISEKTVEFHMSRAISQLRKELAHLYLFIALIMSFFL